MDSADAIAVPDIRPARWGGGIKLPPWLAGLLAPERSHGAGWLAVASVGVALALLLLQSTLYVPTGWGVEDFLGWVDMGPRGPVQAIVALWDRAWLTPFAWAYLAVDSAVFVPVYAAFALLLTDRLARAMAAERREDDAPRTERLLRSLLGAPVLALAGVDLIENTVGLARLGSVAQAFAVAVLVVALVALMRSPALRDHLRAVGAWGAALAAVLAVVLLAAAFGGPQCRSETLPRWLDALWPLGCASHRAKGWLVALVVAALLLAACVWLFGAHFGAAASAALRQSRARLRAAVWDCVVRSRYVLVAIALMAALTVVMDQGRDVVYAMASSPFRAGEFAWWEHALLWAGLGASFAAAALAVWMFVFACWLWTRSACMLATLHGGAAPAAAGAAPPGAPTRPLGPEDDFARDWARVLAFVPVALLVVLCAGVIEDVVMAQSTDAGTPRVHWVGPVTTVLALGLGTIGFGLAFLSRRRQQFTPTGYYDCVSWNAWAQLAGFGQPLRHGATRGKYSFGNLVDPYRLPVFALGGVLACRLFDVFPNASWWRLDYLPTMAFAVIVFSLALWLCFFGWLSMLEIRRSIPWVGLIVAAIGLLGAFGLTDNHRVWSAVAPGEVDATGALRMLVFTAALAGLLLVAYVWAMHVVKTLSSRPPGPLPPGTPRIPARWVPVGVIAALVGTIVIADRGGATARPPDAQPAAAWTRPTLDIALADWLASICNADAGGTCKPSLAANVDGGIDVHFVSTEGGGIRAAVWTAFALQRFAERDAQFLERTFSISGVSGGAVGAAAFRACSSVGGGNASRAACLRRLAQADLLSPLLSAWMFEDALARLLPTSLCDTPACGFLSRGAWFEQSLEAAAPGLRQGLIASGAAQRQRGQAHVPYLFLNATWVESGERAIGSDLRIDWRLFRGAKDPLRIVGADLALGTAAHNAARFPYINAIGALRAPRDRCQTRLGEPLAAGDAAPELALAGEPEVCGHLADGGYFDNSGAQTTLDALQGLTRCLDAHAGDSDAALFPKCIAMPAAQRSWLREHLVPKVLMIRNGVNPVSARQEVCRTVDRPTAGDVTPPPAAGCSALTQQGYHPERPVCRARAGLYVDFIGPALALLHVSGIGANGQLAEARQSQAVRALRASWGGAAARSTDASAVVVDLLPDGVRYPLGWHLSPAATEGMARQAGRCSL
jgi:hypothetical protein